MRLNPVTKRCFSHPFLFQHFQMLDGFIRSDAILPIIGAFIVFWSILNANIRTTVHLSFPDGLFHSPYINHCLIDSIHHLFDTIRGKVTFRTARIAKRHAERTFFVSIQRNGCYIFGMIRDVFRRIIRRTILGISIDTKYAEIARMTRPHPIIRIPSELPDRRRRCKNQADIIIITINR